MTLPGPTLVIGDHQPMTIAVYEVASFNHSRPSLVTMCNKIAYRVNLNASLADEFIVIFIGDNQAVMNS